MSLSLVLCACSEKPAPLPPQPPTPVDSGTSEAPPPEVEDAGVVPEIPEGPETGFLWVQANFRVAGGGAEGIVSLHERGESDRCDQGTGAERTTTGVSTSLKPKRQSTVGGFVRFVFSESLREKLPATTPLCVRYFNGLTQWFLVRDEDFVRGVLELGTFSVQGAPSIRRVSGGGGTGSGGTGNMPVARIDSNAVEKRMDLIAELEKNGDSEAVKRERSRLLEEFGTDSSYAFDKKLKPKTKDSLGKLCRAGCTADDRRRLDFANDLPGL
ncbi:MAG: hypothetical protein JNM17_39415 [Archangium sp.]|nr:hypothetical protein [Archangium sp.]